MLRPYAEILRTPGAVAFSGAALVARLPMSMFGLAIVFAVEHSTGQYAQAGLVSAAALLGQSVGGPFQARLADRWGQFRMLLPVLLAYAVGMVVFILALDNVGLPMLVGIAAATGAALPSAGSLVRTRWARIHTGTPRLHTAYALESVLDEVVYVVGPPLVTVLSTTADPHAGLVLCLALNVVGGLGYALQRSTDPGPQTSGALEEARAAMPYLTLVWVGLAFVFMGAIFGSIEVVTVGFNDELGTPALAGVVLASFAVGSMLAGLAAGSMRWRFSVRRRFVVGQALLAVALLPLPFVGGPLVLGLVAFVAGLAIAPTLIAGFSLVEAEVPAGRLTEGLAWVSTAINVGVAGGAAAAGPVIDGPGASTAFWIPVVSGVVATAVCLLGLRLERARRALGHQAGADERSG